MPAGYYRSIVQSAQWVRKRTLVNLDEEELCQQVVAAMAQESLTITPDLVRACIIADGGFSSEMSRKDLTFLLLESLRKLGKPAHFTEIAHFLNSSGWRSHKTSEKSVNCRLSEKRHLFANISSGTYGLVEWGLEEIRVFDRHKDGLIGDFIEQFLIERDEPAEAAQIVSYVLARKRCQEGSIYQRLSSDPRFQAVGHGLYGMKKWFA